MSTAPREPRARRTRSVSESLLSIVLGLESFLVFFVMLTAFGLRALAPVPAFVGGGVLILVLVLVAGMLRHRWGLWLGWALQVVLIATGFLVTPMFVIGAGFAALWVFCFVRGRQIDRDKAAFLAAQ